MLELKCILVLRWVQFLGHAHDKKQQILVDRLLAAGLGKSRQVWASLGKSTATGNPGIQATGSRARQVKASLGKSTQVLSRQVGGDGKSWNTSYWQLG